MDELRFGWDPAKAAANLKKHGIDFVEAKSVFADEGAKIIPDPDHSEDEDRFILLGLSLNLRLLVACHCYREKVTPSVSFQPGRPRNLRLSQY